MRVPTRQLREHPDLDQLKRQAKELLDAFLSGEPDAVAEVNTLYREAEASEFALHDAQLVIARAYGFESWPKLKAYVDGVTVKRLEEAAGSADLDRVRALLNVRPELAPMSSAMHYAVINRQPEMVRVLMQHGASARDGVYPHRDATNPWTIARERGYDEIVAVITDEEQRQRERKSGVSGAPDPDELFRLIASGKDELAIAMLEATPALIHSCHSMRGTAALHVAAHFLNERLVHYLLDHGADSRVHAWHDMTPLDVAARSTVGEREGFGPIARLLLGRGGQMTGAGAVALGDADWLRARHAEGNLPNPIEDTGGLLTIAVDHDLPDILTLLLAFGFDPDERTRFEYVGGDGIAFTSGMALNRCAASGKHELAEILLKSGANPNASVYASGDPVFTAYSRGDEKMIELLARFGGVPCATTAGLYRRTALAMKMIAGEAPYRLERGGTLAEELLWGAACGGDPAIVKLALDRVDWRRDDPRWFEILEQPLRIWKHGPAGEDWDRNTYLACFRLVLERCDANLPGRRDGPRPFGLTILHSVCGAREHVTADERLAFATMLLDAGARLDPRDELLKSTPLGWACRWGRIELVKLFLARGADPIEPDAEPWARPKAWAEKRGRHEVLMLLEDEHPEGVQER
jgi:ankyrin repeat protein